jgi:ABC-type sugar transport system ATPase subunit
VTWTSDPNTETSGGYDPRPNGFWKALASMRERDRPSVPMLEVRDLTKRFPGQIAVDHVSFTVHCGEVHGVVGENGAGKTTLIKLLAGEYQADDGQIFIEGEPVSIEHTWNATKLGLAFIHQELALIPSLSVRENLALGLGFRTSRVGLISWKKQEELARQALSRVGLDVDPRVRLGDLSIHEQQLVAIARILLLNGKVIVFDEVTAPLSESEVERLFDLVTELSGKGVSIIYISHRLEEIFRLAHRVTVLKNGALVGTEEVKQLSPHELAALIIGKDPGRRFIRQETDAQGDVLLSVRGLEDEMLTDVSFDVRKGEVLGLAGLAGSGRTNILEILFGARRAVRGEIRLRGTPIEMRHPADAIRNGIALVPEDRKRQGYVASFTTWQNVTLPWLGQFSPQGLLQPRRERKSGIDAMRRFDVRAPSHDAPMRLLSGGNQQKAILARWLTRSLSLVLLDQPTHGVDIGAKEEIYDIIHHIARQGTPVILASDELEELEGLCSRVLLITDGRIVGELIGEEIKKPTMLNTLLVGHLDDASDAH